MQRLMTGSWIIHQTFCRTSLWEGFETYRRKPSMAVSQPGRLADQIQLAISQSISGTGALRIGTAFLARFYPHAKTIYLPSPTWGNHVPISRDAGLEVKQYKWVSARM